MDSKNCKMLLTALRAGSLTAAADELGYTTGGVSRAINTLEKQAGFPILRRSHQGVELTPEGRELLPTIQAFVRLDERYEQQSAEFNGLQVGTVVVGTAYPFFYSWLSFLLKDFHRTYPGIDMQIIEGTSSELAHMVEERELDFGLTSERKGDSVWIPLMKDELWVIMPAGHEYVNYERISQELLARAPFIELHPGRESDNSLFFESCGIEPKIAFSTNDTLALYAMVGAGMGISLINGIMAKHLPAGIVGRPLDPTYRIDCGAIAPLEEDLSPAARRFGEFALSRKDRLPK